MGRNERDCSEAFPVLVQDFLRRTGGTVMIPSFRTELDLDAKLHGHEYLPPGLRVLRPIRHVVLCRSVGSQVVRQAIWSQVLLY